MTKRTKKKKVTENHNRKARAKKKARAVKAKTVAGTRATTARKRRARGPADAALNWTTAAPLFADHLRELSHTYSDLSVRLTDFLLKNFANAVNDPEPDKVVPIELTSNVLNLQLTCNNLRSAFESDHTWGINPNKFTLDGGTLVDAVNDHEPRPTIGWLIAKIYHFVLAARL